MILIDSSAWIEYLRATGSPADKTLTNLLAGEAPLATTDVVRMEVLSGARDDPHLQGLRGLLARCTHLPVVGPGDWEDAAALYRACRRKGVTVRRLTDCLIAAVAIREGVPVLHCDVDFEALASCTALHVVAADLDGS